MRDAAQRAGGAAGLAAALAAVVYAIVGIADAAVSSASVSQLALVALIYATVGIVAGAATLACVRAFRAVRRKPLRPVCEGVTAALVAATGLLTGYGIVWLNRYVLLDYPWFSSVAIGTTLGFCLLVGLVGLRLERAMGELKGGSVWLTGVLALSILGMAAMSLRPETYTFAERSKRPTDLPNIVVLVSDCVRADHVSAYGYALETTPLFDRIAAEGVLFEDAHASASWTLPSVTGTLASTRAGIDVRPGVSGTELKASTLPEVLSELGYTTFAASNNPHLGGRFGVGSRFDAFDAGTTRWERALDTTLVGVVRQRLWLIDDGTMVDRAIRTLRNLPEPFFVYLHVMGGTPRMSTPLRMSRHFPFRRPRIPSLARTLR